MNKRKVMKIIVLSVLSVILLGSGVLLGIQLYEDSKISFTVNDTLPDGQGKKVKVILLAGQSNASGCSLDAYLKRNVTFEKYAEYDGGYENVYINYFVSDSNKSQKFVKCATRQGEWGTCFGPELGLAEKLHEIYPEEMFFIIKYAWGGTDLHTQWLSPSSPGKTGKLYKHFTKYVEASIEYLVSKNYDVEIEGLCWMQGESDSFSVENGKDYEMRLKNFVKDVRRTFSHYAAEDGIAFIDATIANNPAFWVYCDLVNQSKQKVAADSAMNVLIDTNAEGLICTQEPEEQPDIPHYDSMSQIKLGHLFGEALSDFLH